MSLTPPALAVLTVLHDLTAYSLGELFVPFAPLIERTGLDRAQVRRHCRYFARKGLAEYSKGLWTEDGEPAGAGYGITSAGIHALALAQPPAA